jgi:hypothetical protein
MLEYVQTNWMEISVIAGIVIVLASRVAKLTPTQTDDKVVAALRKLALVLSIDVPDNPGKPKE